MSRTGSNGDRGFTSTHRRVNISTTSATGASAPAVWSRKNKIGLGPAIRIVITLTALPAFFVDVAIVVLMSSPPERS